MKLSLGKQQNLIKAIVVAVIVMILGAIGLDIPRATVQEAVDTGFESLNTAASLEPDAVSTASIMHVVDGDTMTVLIAGKEDTVRLIGINTPEVAGSPRGAQCYGEEASTRAQELLTGQTVTLTTDTTQATRDTYNRLLAYITLPDGTDFGETMIAAGYAREYTYAAPYEKQAAYRSAEAVAKRAGEGLWSCE